MTHLRLTQIRPEGKPTALLVPVRDLVVYINDDYETVILVAGGEFRVEESFEDVAAMLAHRDGAFFLPSNEGKESEPATKN